MPELKSEEGGDMFLLPHVIKDPPPPSPPQSKLNPVTITTLHPFPPNNEFETQRIPRNYSTPLTIRKGRVKQIVKMEVVRIFGSWNQEIDS